MKVEERRKNLREIHKKIKSTYNEMPKDLKKILAVIVAASCIISVGAKSCSSKKDESVKTMLVDVTDDVILLDEEGNKIILDADSSELLAVVSGQKIKKGKLYDAALVDASGNMYKGMLDGKYITEDVLDIEDTTKDILSDGNVNIVDAYSGMWIRKEKIEDPNTENAKMLENGTQVLSSSVSEAANNVSAHTWKESISVDRTDNSLYTGYMAETYLMNNNYDKAEGKRFSVNSKKVPLKLRTRHEISDSNIISELYDGTEVLLVPNMASYSDDNHDWFYVAVKNNDGAITFGWCCATQYLSEGNKIHYLVEKESEKEETEIKKEDNVELIVDTKEDNYHDLNLRIDPSKSSKILVTIENGTIIYTTSSALKEADEMKKIDGHKWLKVRLISGQEGYVAADFVKENYKVKEKNDVKPENSGLNNDAITVDIPYEGTLNGVIGLDLDPRNGFSADDLERLLKNDYDYKGYEGKIENRQKPSFVYIRMGGSDCGRHGKGPLTNIYTSDFDKLSMCVELCNRYNIPFGYYYYSQAVTTEEAKKEASWINQTLNRLGNYEYNVLPFAIDVEDRWYSGGLLSTRVKESAYNNGSDYQTSITNEVMNMVRNQNYIDVILYTDNNTLSSEYCKGFTLNTDNYPATVDYSKLDDINKQNPWVVDVSSTHSYNLTKNHNDIISEAAIRQIAIDKTNYPVSIDINFTDADYYDELTKSLN